MLVGILRFISGTFSGYISFKTTNMARPFIELYVGDRLVEFTNPPQINITYAHEDLHNPTVVKNSFSKTVTVDGTPVNNQIFGSYFDMRRNVAYSEGKNTGAYFNPSKKVPFTLYRNGEIVESGYCKLDNVKRTGENIQYNVTLYGGLGQFLYNLSYREDGEEMKLSDLDYGTDFKMAINKETIRDAWNHVNGVRMISPIYDKINFAPAYNGIPKDFAADKVAVDVHSFEIMSPSLYNQFKLSDGEFKAVDGWVLGELEKEYDEWQMKDLRSYLQRPVIRFKEIIGACCNPKNNGGYNVELDEDFFNADNPYYENAWMTLPLLTEIEGIESTADITVSEDGTGRMDLSGLAEGDIFNADLNYFVTSNAVVELQSNGYGYTLDTGVYTFDRNTPLISANMAIYSQLVAYDRDGNAVGGSNVLALSRKYGSIPSNFEYDLEFDAPVTFVNGSFYYMPDEDYRYRFFDAVEIGGYVGGDLPIHKLKLDKMTYTDGMYLKFVTKIATIDNGTVKGYAGKLFWTEGYEAYPTEPYLSEKWSEVAVNRVKSGWGFNKNTILNSENTPCDYFLSYIKMFNLHIWKDMYEDTIYVKLRKNYFTGEEYDLDDYVDRGNEIEITPLTFDAKWYLFNSEYDSNSQLVKDYKDEHGLGYGVMKVDTNYNFDSSSKSLFDGNVFKGAVTNRGMSRYYVDIYQAFGDDEVVHYPPFLLDGMKTFLFNGSDTAEASYITPKTSAEAVNWWKDKYYDVMPKPSFVNDKNEGIDGANVLLFYNGKTELKDVEGNRMWFQLTDDIPQFDLLNEGEPCWIWSMDWDVSLDYMNYMPQFSRYVTNENNWVTHSWDFGTPKALYIPDYSIDDSSNIYTQYWQPYIRDRYDVNTRVVNCKVLLKENVLGDWLRRFYYWDGSWWVMNKITDYNPTGDDTTKCEFVKIQDTENYR